LCGLFLLWRYRFAPPGNGRSFGAHVNARGLVHARAARRLRHLLAELGEHLREDLYQAIGGGGVVPEVVAGNVGQDHFDRVVNALALFQIEQEAAIENLTNGNAASKQIDDGVSLLETLVGIWPASREEGERTPVGAWAQQGTSQ
jgi:hypothetical protein